MNNLVRTDHPEFRKDMVNRALVNTNDSGLISYKKRKRLIEEQKQDINMLKDRVDNVDESLKRIEGLLENLIHGNK